MKRTQLTNESSYFFETKRANWLATVKRIKNDINGNPRVEIRLTCLKWFADKYQVKNYQTLVYRLGTNYRTEEQTASDIIQEREEKLMEIEKEYFENRLYQLLGYREQSIMDNLANVVYRKDNERDIYTLTDKYGYSFEYDETFKKITN